MISFLDGQIIQCFSEMLVISVQGIGYLVYSHSRFLRTLKPLDSVCVYTYQIIKDDTIRLFGFPYIEERDLFTTLIQVSGLGPKLALVLLSSYPPDKIAQFVYEDDIISLTAVNGIGKKGAQRLILELKDKIKSFLSSNKNDALDSFVISPDNQLEKDAILALKKLGLSEKDAISRVSKVIKKHSNDSLSVQELIRLCFIESGDKS